MADLLQNIFRHGYNNIEDNTTSREPAFVVDIATIFPNNEGGNLLLFYGMSLGFWVHMTLAMVISGVVNTMAAILIFVYILPHRDSASVSAYTLGWGFVIPMSFVLPFQLVRFLEIENVAVIFGFIAIPAYLPFRCIEAMYGTSPRFAEKSIGSYILYHALPIPLDFDSKTGMLIPIEKGDLWGAFKNLLWAFCQAVALFSLLEATDYAPFPTKRPARNLLEFLYWGNLLNNYIVAYAASTMLSSGSFLFQIVVSSVSGFRAISFNDRPLTASTSPSDFWGRRWNKQVQGVLKRGVYKPIRMFFPHSVAVFGTFFASGLLHEYTLLMARQRAVKDGTMSTTSTYDPQYGLQFLFFLWNFFVLSLERYFKDNSTLKFLGETLPRPIITSLVLLTVLPISHWFTDEWIAAGVFTSVAEGHPRIVLATTRPPLT